MLEQLDVLLAETRQKARARDTGDWPEKERLILEQCHPKQRQYVLDPAKRISALTGRGGGKTTGARARLMRRMLHGRRPRCVYICTTRSQAEDLMWAPLKDLCERLSLEGTFNETKLRLTLARNGGTLRLVGADDKREIEKLRGQPFHEVIVDEAASYPAQLLDHLIFRVIGPRLGDFGGTLSLIGTPGHQLSGPFYDATRNGSKSHRPWERRDEFDPDWQKWSSHFWTLQDGAEYVPAMARLWAEALVEKGRNEWSDHNPVWRREYLGQWAADDTEMVFRYRPHLEDGTQWNQWDPTEKDAATGIFKVPEGDGEWHYVYGLDLGHSDPMALVIWAYRMNERVLYQVYNFERRGMYAQTIAQLLLGEEMDADEPGGLIGVTGWPDAIVADTAGLGDALLDELSNVYGLRIEPALKKNKHDAIELFNGDLVEGRIKILKKSTLEDQLLELQWAIDDFGRLKENKAQANHSTDAAVYGRTAAHHQFKDEPAHVDPREAAQYRLMFEEADGDDAPKPPAVGEFAGLLGDGEFIDDFWAGE